MEDGKGMQSRGSLCGRRSPISLVPAHWAEGGEPVLRRPTRRARASAKAGGRECGGACGKCQPLPGRGARVRVVMTLVSGTLAVLGAWCDLLQAQSVLLVYYVKRLLPPCRHRFSAAVRHLPAVMVIRLRLSSAWVQPGEVGKQC